MAGRIRSLKPEVLDDDKVASLSDAAFRLWVSGIVLCDDHGSYPAGVSYLHARVFWGSGRKRKSVIDLMQELSDLGLVVYYTVRDQMKSDFDGTIAKVAQIGYKEVEFAGYFDHTPQQVRAALDKNGLTSPSCHVEYNLLRPDK